MKAMRERAEYFIANDVQLVWLVFPRKRYVEVYSPDHEMEILFGSDSLSGGDRGGGGAGGRGDGDFGEVRKEPGHGNGLQ